MEKVAGRESERWLRLKDLENFPCQDLSTIDKLWVKYSNGKFGFSVQKQIYQSLGGKKEYDRKVWEAFGDKVGWRQGGRWLRYNEITFNTSTPYVGHLPKGIEEGGGVSWWEVLFYRTDSCIP
ncbi:GUN4 domain-containing protein [Okeania sp. SIO3I5]|uniref:GUN4 domain-containing protein n=1 Tax=Okeania sp. SIO3I5 TaxID=2607805 RepID=UPI0034423371